MEEKRERWISRPAFILAAVGSAVGLGNVWRFPHVAFQNGGGAFLIPYFIALLTTGIPVMILEYGLGQRLQGSTSYALSKVSKKFEFVGWWALTIGTFISLYYCVVMGWAWRYLAVSLKMPWGEETKDYFYNTILKISSGPLDIGSLNWPIIMGLALTWVCIYFIIYKGVIRVGKVVYITVPLPIILLVILFFRGITLPGAIEGIKFYLTPDFSVLKDPGVWLAAYGQIFFSLSLGFGILMAYASYKPRDSEITNNAFITSLANCGTSFFAGFAVFSILGYLAQIQGKAVADVAAGGPGLAFVAYPLALSKLPALGGLCSFAFFLMLLTLGIDSAFSIVEGVVSGLHDKWEFKKSTIIFWFCVFGFLGGLIFATGAGLYWLDIVDHWMNNFGLTIIGLAECLIIGYAYDIKGFRKYLNEVSEIQLGSWWDICIKYVTPGILGIILILNFYKEFSGPYESYPMKALFIGGWGVAILAMVMGVLISDIKKIIKVSVIAGVLALSLMVHFLQVSDMARMIVMLLFGVVVLFGGLTWCILIAYRSGKKARYVDAECATDLCEVEELEE